MKKENRNVSLPPMNMENELLNNIPLFMEQAKKEHPLVVSPSPLAVSAKPIDKSTVEHPLTGKLREMAGQLRNLVDRLVGDDVTQSEIAFDCLVDGIKVEAKNINQQLHETTVVPHGERAKWNGLEAAESLWREIGARQHFEKEQEEKRAEWRKGFACWLEKQPVRGRGDKRSENQCRIADAVASLRSAVEPFGDTLLPGKIECKPEDWWAIYVDSDKWKETVHQLRERWKLDQLADLIEEEIVTPDATNEETRTSETAEGASLSSSVTAPDSEPDKKSILMERKAPSSGFSDTPPAPKTLEDITCSEGTETVAAKYSASLEGNFSLPVTDRDMAIAAVSQSDMVPQRLEAERGADEAFCSPAEQMLPVSPNPKDGERAGSDPDVSESKKTAHMVSVMAQTGPRDFVHQCVRSYRNEKPDSANNLICALLLDDKIDIAYHFARCVEQRTTPADDTAAIFPSSALIRCLALAGIMSDQYGLEADDYATSMAEVFDKTDFFSRSEDTSYIALALGLLPLIMFRPRLSRAVALMQNVDVRLPAVRQIHRVALELSNSNVEFASVVKSDLDTMSIEHQMKNLRDKCRDWREKESRRNFNYIPTGGLWEYWLDPNRELGSLIDAVINDRRDRLESLIAIETKWKSKKHFDRERESADRAVRANQARTKPISDKAITELRRRVDDALRQFKSWHVLVLASPSAAGSNSDFIRKNRSILIQSIPEAHKQLEQLSADSGTQPFLKASVHLLNNMFSRLQDLLNGNGFVEPISIHRALNRTLLAVPGVLLSDDFRIQEEPDNLEEALLANLGNPIDWERVARDRAASDDFTSMQQALHELELIRPEREPGVRRELEKLQDKRSRDIEKNLATARDDLSTAYAEGLLDDDQRNVFAHDFEQDAEKQERFFFLSRRIHQLQELIVRKRDEVSENLRKELCTISELDPDNRALVEQALEARDFAAATEYMDYLVRGEKIPIFTSIDKEPTFFPSFLREFGEAFSDASNPGRLPPASDILKKFSSHSIPDFMKGDDRARTAGITILEGWNGIRKNRGDEKIRATHVETVMREIGFTVKNVAPSAKYINNSYFAFEMTTEVLKDRDYCPIPHFGSQAKGRYRLLVFTNKLDVHQVIDHVTRDADDERTIVLYLDYLSENSRRDLSHRCKNMEPASSFLLLDNYLVMFLLNKTNRLRSFFRAALQFTSGKPYFVATTPEMFFGRKRQLDSICSRTGACLVYGGRQLGKTALLKAAERKMHQPESGRIAKYLDLTHDHRTNLGKSRPIEDIWGILAELLQDDIKTLRRVTTPKSFRDNINEWLGPKRDRNRSILLLLDEADIFLETDRRDKPEGRWSIVGALKSMIRDFDGVFKVVFAGLHNVYKIASEPNTPLAHLGEPICVGAFFNDEVRDAVRMIKEPLGVLGYEFQDENRLIYRMLGNTNYYPSFIQILCRELLNILREDDSLATKDSPPYKITIDHVKKAYNESQDEILDKFRLSLKLDSRYLVLALVIAYSIEESNDHPRDLDMWKIRQGALEWWSKGFEKFSKIEHIETLLNEMIGLGILRSPRPGHYALRNDKVQRLLCSSGSLENQLFEASEEEPPREFVEASFRRSLREESVKRSVLTVQQERQLHNLNSNVAVIFGCDAAGLNDVDDTLETLGQCTTLQGTADLGSTFDEAAKNMFISWSEKDDDATWKFLVVHPEDKWEPEWVRKAMAIAKKHGKHIGKQKKIKIVFIGNPENAFNWIFKERTADLADVTLTLTPWNEDMIRDWIASSNGMSIDISLLPQLIAKTGAWGATLERICQHFLQSFHASDAFRLLLTQEPPISPYTPEDGFCVDETGGEIFRILASLSTPLQGAKKSNDDDGIYVGEPLPYSDLRDYFDDKPEISKKLAAYLAWAKLLGYARNIDDKWQLNIIFSEIGK